MVKSHAINLRGLALTVLALSTISCSRTLEVQVIRYSWLAPLAPKPGDCQARVYREPSPPECSDIGDVFVGDTGYTSDCGLDRMLDAVREQACLYGADAAEVVRMESPSFWGSSCYEIRAKFLKCGVSS